MMRRLFLFLVFAALAYPAGQAAVAQESDEGSKLLLWQTNEIHFQYGHDYKIAFVAGNPKQKGYIFTIQHADGWKYGDNFFFFDFTDAETTGFDIYGEAYANFSLGKITGSDLSFGPFKDFGIIAGINYAMDAKVLKFLPGVRLVWNVPGFAFLNTDITAYIDASGGTSKGGAPTETNGFMVDFNWAFPISIGKHDFSIEGHIEYIHSRTNEFGGDVAGHVLGQPQFRYDLGKTLFNAPGHFFIGIEYQFWINKLGDDGANEHIAQALVVGRF